MKLKMEENLKDKLFKQFLSTSLSSIQDIKNGEIMSYFVKDVGEIRGMLYRLLSHGTRIIFTFIIAISFIATICGDGDKGLFDLFK